MYLLNEEDRTRDGPPNDEAVELYLRMEGNYTLAGEECDKVLQASPFEEIQVPKSWVLVLRI